MNGIASPPSVTSPTLHATIAFALLAFMTMVVLAVALRVEVVARGEGKVVPIARVQIVQPEFDGKITAINVTNGSLVAQGDSLIELDRTDAEAQLYTLEEELSQLAVERARLDAFANAIEQYDPLSPDFVTKTMGSFEAGHQAETKNSQEQRSLLRSQIDALLTSLARIRAGVAANAKSLDVTRAEIARVDAALASQRERLEVAKALWDRGTSSRIAFLDVKDVLINLEYEREVFLRQLDEQATYQDAAIADRRQLLSTTRNDMLRRRAEVEASRARLAQERRSAQRRFHSASLKAPLSGIVAQLDTFTIGAVAAAGSELLRIVPQNQKIEFEAMFANQDIGFVAVGQTVNIKLDAYPAERFGYIKGSVTGVAADSIEISEGKWGYAIRVTPDKTYLVVDGTRHPLKPGMTATVDVTTDERRLISYFFAPIVGVIQDALGEQ